MRAVPEVSTMPTRGGGGATTSWRCSTPSQNRRRCATRNCSARSAQETRSRLNASAKARPLWGKCPRQCPSPVRDPTRPLWGKRKDTDRIASPKSRLTRRKVAPTNHHDPFGGTDKGVVDLTEHGRHDPFGGKCALMPTSTHCRSVSPHNRFLTTPLEGYAPRPTTPLGGKPPKARPLWGEKRGLRRSRRETPGSLLLFSFIL